MTYRHPASQFGRAVLSATDAAAARAAMGVFGGHLATGTVGNGSTNDRSALATSDDAAAASGLPLVLPSGTYRVTSDLTIDSPVLFSPEAILKPDNEVTVTLAGGIVNASMAKIFDPSAGGLVAVKNVAALYPQWWGAVGDGVTDDSDAFAATYKSALKTRNSVDPGIPYETTPVRPQAMISIPPGTYLITQPESLMSSPVSGSQTRGLKYVGSGRWSTLIIFDAANPNSYLLNNNNKHSWLTFEDLTFASRNDNGSFMKSTSDGHAQNYVFNRVDWVGAWTYGLDLKGTNTNSEMSWFHCGMYGDWGNYLHVGSDETILADQFVTYNFTGCNAWMNSGNLVDMHQGGNISWIGGGLIHRGDGLNTQQIFFALRRSTHSGGIARLYVNGPRIEHRHIGSQLLFCEWQNAIIMMENVDASGYATLLVNPTQMVQCEIKANVKLPEIVFDNCHLMGTHKYHWANSSYLSRNTAHYRSCKIWNSATASEFVTFEPISGATTLGSKPPVYFDKCVGSTSDVFDTTLNWNVAVSPVLSPRFVSMKHPGTGGLPYVGISNATAKLPLNAVIVRVRSWKPATGSNTSTNFAYTLTDADGAVIATATGSGGQWKDGYTYDSGALTHICSTENKRTLTLTPTNITATSTDNMFVIEYLG